MKIILIQSPIVQYTNELRTHVYELIKYHWCDIYFAMSKNGNNLIRGIIARRIQTVIDKSI